MSKDLTPKQELFCREYLISMNFADAARKAGYSSHVAKTGSRDFLDHPGIKARLQELQAPAVARFEVATEQVLKELFRIATCDIGLAFNEDGTMKALHEIPEDVRRAIQAVETEQLFDGQGKDRYQVGHTKRIKFWDKNKALEMLAKHLKLLTDRIEHSGSFTLEQLVAASQKKVTGDK